QSIFKADELLVDEPTLAAFKQIHTAPVEPIGLSHINLRQASETLRKELAKKAPSEKPSQADIERNLALMEDVPFAHLHNHTQFSVLQSTTSIPALIAATVKHGMPAVAMTDHANMMGAFHFVNQVLQHNVQVEMRNQEALAKEEF